MLPCDLIITRDGSTPKATDPVRIRCGTRPSSLPLEPLEPCSSVRGRPKGIQYQAPSNAATADRDGGYGLGQPMILGRRQLPVWQRVLLGRRRQGFPFDCSACSTTVLAGPNLALMVVKAGLQ